MSMPELGSSIEQSEAQVGHDSSAVFSVKKGSTFDRIRASVTGIKDSILDRRDYALSTLAGLALLASACKGDKPSQHVDNPPNQSVAAATRTPEAIPSPTVVATKTQIPGTVVPGGNPDQKFPTPTTTSTPEVKKEVNCGILSPEACANGEYIQWTGPTGKKFTGMGFALKQGEKIMIPKDLQVATSGRFPAPNTYNGVDIIGVSSTGELSHFIGALKPREELTSVGKPFLKGVPVGEIVGNESVFLDTPYNLIYFLPGGDITNQFPDQTARPPKIINNVPVSSASPSTPSATFFENKSR